MLRATWLPVNYKLRLHSLSLSSPPPPRLPTPRCKIYKQNEIRACVVERETSSSKYRREERERELSGGGEATGRCWRRLWIEQMATPMAGSGGGGVAVLANSVERKGGAESPAVGLCLEEREPESPISMFLYFHKAIRNELDALHKLAMAFATGQREDIRPLLDRYQFLRSIYKHHSNAEDEVTANFVFLFVSCSTEFSVLRFYFAVLD